MYESHDGQESAALDEEKPWLRTPGARRVSDGLTYAVRFFSRSAALAGCCGADMAKHQQQPN